MGIMDVFEASLGLFLHHSEFIDPTLWEWIQHKIDELFGLGPTTIVVVLGAMTVAFPVGLMALAMRRIRKSRRQ